VGKAAAVTVAMEMPQTIALEKCMAKRKKKGKVLIKDCAC
jgi:hypothetical protein